jgi:hypothetical protein
MKRHFLKCVKYFGWGCWLLTKELAETLLIMAAFFYLLACFGEGQPQHFLNGHEAWAVFGHFMKGVIAKGACLP